MLIVYAPLGDAPAGYDHPTMAESPIDTLLRWGSAAQSGERSP